MTKKNLKEKYMTTLPVGEPKGYCWIGSDIYPELISAEGFTGDKITRWWMIHQGGANIMVKETTFSVSTYAEWAAFFLTAEGLTPIDSLDITREMF